ncbi:MAG TPA: hypothetical protein PLJ42_09705 [Chitinophagales bacterium]|jgi:hypothetical protein|nr:hypothetical protein [Chitinophagales bacterium]MBP6154294.1 hypothetical protein [Chitinophagales bacterium]HQV77197.1 hypothetical protein [Chitinophagales bacterium]HQW79696.1 hypothetical protein [Chitinophagales bacterium]HRB67639.1 hypothetical protein [Chitinophagales bacterium]
MRTINFFLFLFVNVCAFAITKTTDIIKPKNNSATCVQAFINKAPLNSGNYLSKNSKGILTVSKGNKSKILFNITLKSNIGKNGEPPIYLRFIKQKQLNISEILEYASDGDEIFIEEFIPSVDKADLNCMPASITVVES